MGHATLSIEDHLKLRLKGLSTKFKKLMMFHNLINNMGEIVVFFNLKNVWKELNFCHKLLSGCNDFCIIKFNFAAKIQFRSLTLYIFCLQKV